MKSKLFRDAQILDEQYTVCAPNQLSVCLRMSRQSYAWLLEEAQRQQISSGALLDKLIAREIEPQQTLH